MAKKSSREYVTLECTECKNRNYRTSKQTKSRGTKKEKQIEKLLLKKYCKFDRAHTEHRERKK
jgi:large subunit ribosomal protein L33